MRLDLLQAEIALRPKGLRSTPSLMEEAKGAGDSNQSTFVQGRKFVLHFLRRVTLVQPERNTRAVMARLILPGKKTQCELLRINVVHCRLPSADAACEQMRRGCSPVTKQRASVSDRGVLWRMPSANSAPLARTRGCAGRAGRGVSCIWCALRRGAPRAPRPDGAPKWLVARRVTLKCVNLAVPSLINKLLGNPVCSQPEEHIRCPRRGSALSWGNLLLTMK
jgi:hypothetical protein